MIEDFEIDDVYLCDVVDRKEWGRYDHIPRDQITHEQLIEIIMGNDRCSTTGTKDHPEFAKLRDTLEEEGYIKCERGWWNGDKVLKPFTLNGAKFKEGEQFPSGCAMKGHLKYMKR
jgi:hypothetical protein